jgi:flagellar basal-body rod modification protein FlgD
MTMGVFDIGSMQSAASVVAGSLAPKQTVAQSLNAMPVRANAASSSTSSTSSTASATGGTITSSDFLTLLVSELKNQDPTQPTDPNAYITQLVGVNSLQQLISINQGIGTLNTPSAPATTATQSTPAV